MNTERDVEQRQGRRRQRLRRRLLRRRHPSTARARARRERPRHARRRDRRGRGDNAVGVVGICWKATVMSVKFLDARGRGGTADAVDAIDYAVREGREGPQLLVRHRRRSRAPSRARSRTPRRRARSSWWRRATTATTSTAAVVPGGVHRRQHPDGRGDDVPTTARRLLELRRHVRRRGRAGVSILSTLPGGGYGAMTARRWPRRSSPVPPRCCARPTRAPPTASCAPPCVSMATPAALEGKVVYGGRLNVERALAVID